MANDKYDEAERSQALTDHLRGTRPAEYYAAYLKMVAKTDAPQSGWAWWQVWRWLKLRMKG